MRNPTIKEGNWREIEKVQKPVDKQCIPGLWEMEPFLIITRKHTIKRVCLTKPQHKALYNNRHGDTHTQQCKQCSLKTSLLNDTIIRYSSRILSCFFMWQTSTQVTHELPNCCRIYLVSPRITRLGHTVKWKTFRFVGHITRSYKSM